LFTFVVWANANIQSAAISAFNSALSAGFVGVPTLTIVIAQSGVSCTGYVAPGVNAAVSLSALGATTSSATTLSATAVGVVSAVLLALLL